VKLFFDTSVLVPVFSGDHVHHSASKAAFIEGNRQDRSCGAHSLAEFYSALTGFPGKQRVDANDALLFIDEILRDFSIVALTAEEYTLAIRDAARDGVVGATIYDGLLARCAIKARADVIYTWNVKHFAQFPEIKSRVRTP
jgi:predicted nucleic acid-binding protein